MRGSEGMVAEHKVKAAPVRMTAYEDTLRQDLTLSERERERYPGCEGVGGGGGSGVEGEGLTRCGATGAQT